ncbi:MAG: discoidin domain-containing protein [Candidatus Nitrospinota bacterium M3_3B_026]
MIRSRLALAAALLIAGIAVRAPYIARYHDVVNLDEATVGVMALDVLAGDIPLFFYGQKYFGPFEAFFLAGAFKLFPVTSLTLRLTIAAMSFAAVFFFWLGARRIMGREGALMTAAFLLIPPPILSIWSSLASGGHVGGLLLGGMVFWLGARVIELRSRGAIFFFLYGALIGFSTWMHPGVLLFVAGAAVAAVIADPRLLASRAVPSTIAGAALGGAPLWVVTFYEKFRTFQFGQERAAGRSLEAMASDLVVSIENVPPLMGFELFPAPFGGIASYIFAALIAAGLIFALRPRDFFSGGSAAVVIGAVVMALNVALYALVDANKWGWVQYRYYLPFVAGTALVLGYLFKTLYGRWKFLGGAFCAAVIGVNLAANVMTAAGAERFYRMDTRLDERFFLYDRLLPSLDALNITDLYVRLYDDAPIAFESRGRIAAVAYSDSRLRKRSLAVDAARRPAFAFLNREKGRFDKALDAIGAAYSVYRDETYTVYHDIKPPPWEYVPLDLSGAEAGASPNGAGARFAIDRDFSTVWNTSREQKGDEFIQIDLGRVEMVSRVDILPSWITDAPVGVAVDVSLDGGSWRTVAEVEDHRMTSWAGPHPVSHLWEGFNQLIFEPAPARFVKVRQTGESRLHWHVREIFVYERTPAATPVPAPDWDAVMAFLKAEGVESVIGDFYFSANVVARSGGAIWANIRRNELNEDGRAKWIFSPGETGAIAVTERDARQVRSFMDAQGWGRRARNFGGYRIFYDLNVPEEDAGGKFRWTGSHIIWMSGG